MFQKSELNPQKLKINNVDEKSHSTLENFNINNEPLSSNYYCKFCRINGHSMIKCKKYSTYQQRKDICNNYQLCIYCTSSKHNSQNCLGLSNKLTYPCIYCNKNSHISALCRESKILNSNICINSSVGNVDNLFLLPIICINVFKGKSKFSLNCLLVTAHSVQFFKT